MLPHQVLCLSKGGKQIGIFCRLLMGSAAAVSVYRCCLLTVQKEGSNGVSTLKQDSRLYMKFYFQEHKERKSSSQVTLISDSSMKKPRNASTLAVTDCGQPAAGHFSLQLLYLWWCRETSLSSALHRARWVCQSPVEKLKSLEEETERVCNCRGSKDTQMVIKW